MHLTHFNELGIADFIALVFLLIPKRFCGRKQTPCSQYRCLQNEARAQQTHQGLHHIEEMV